MKVLHRGAAIFNVFTYAIFKNGATWPFIAAMALFPVPAAAVGLLEMSDRFDQMDKGDLDATLSKANQCTAVRDYACAEKQLREAKKYANDAKSKNALKIAENGLAAEKGREREEERIAAEKQRRQEAREEKQRMAEQRARDAEMQAQRQADEQADLNARIASVGNAYANTLRAQAGARADDQARQRQFDQQRAQVAASDAREQRRFAQERAQLESQRGQQQQQQQQRENDRIQLAQAQSAQQAQQAQARQQELQRSQEAEARRRNAAAAEAQRKTDEQNAKQEEASKRQNYLSAVQRSLKLGASHCPGGNGKHFVFGLMPNIKPAVVDCLHVEYSEICPGSAVGSSGAIHGFVGMGTDCFSGDAGDVSPTPACDPKQARVVVTSVTACSN